MPKVSLSVNFIQKIKSTEKKVDYLDDKCPGLMLRVMPSGSMTFYSVRRVAGKAVYTRIGSAFEFSLDEARRRVCGARSERADDIQHPTFRMALDMYFEARRLRGCSERGIADSMRRIELYVNDRFLDKRIADTLRGECERLMFNAAKEAKESGRGGDGKRTATLLMTDLRAAVNYLMRNDYPIQKNPADITFFANVERARYLSEEEVGSFFRAVEQSDNADFRDFVKLAVFTGKRKSNILGMRWEWVDLERGTLVIPATDTKNRREDAFPLSEFALKVLRRRRLEQQQDGKACSWVFPSSRAGCGHIVEVRAAWREALKRAGISDFRMHDQRRTLASWMAANNTSFEMIADALGQSSTMATHIYARYAIDPKRKAIEEAGAKLARAAGLEGMAETSARIRLDRMLDNDPALAGRLLAMLSDDQQQTASQG